MPFAWPIERVQTDTVWEGEFHVQRRMFTAAGVSLTIKPGSVIRFARNTFIWARGPIEAVGGVDNPITFTSIEKTTEQEYWNTVMTDLSEALFVHCRFENASMAIHSHFSKVTVDHCFFRNNESGFRFRSGPVEIKNSVFKDNFFGIVAYLVKAKVTGNLFTKNQVGILVREERNKGTAIHLNNFVDNLRYNLRVGDFNRGSDVDALENWWGGADPLLTIFDQRTEPDIGFVLYEPFATEPYKLQVPSW